MKRVTAIIKPFKLDAVREALIAAGVSGMTVTEVKGFGRQKGHHQVRLAGDDDDVYFVPKLMLEVVVDDNVALDVVEIVRTAVVTGKIGDGKIFMQEVASATRIRTGETGSDAL
jgi:nitrogen regulatory protein P-II 2